VSDQVDINAQQVSNGAAQWQAASASLEAAWEAARGAIAGAGNCWGSDAPGSAFAASFKPDETLFGSGGQQVLDQVSELGPKVEKAVGLSMAADEEQAAKMMIPVKGD